MALSTRDTNGNTLGVTRARQGRTGRHVFWVLLFGTLLAALALFAAWTWRSGDLASTEPNNGRQAADAQAFDTPAPPTTARQGEQDSGRVAPPAR